MIAEIVRQEAFEDVQLHVIEHEGEEWFTAEDIGRALGFSEPRKAVLKILERNKDEFEGLECVVNLTTHSKDGKTIPRKMKVFNLQGVYKIGFFADTPRAKAFRHWASFMLSRGMERLRRRIQELEAGGARARRLPPPAAWEARERERLEEMLQRQREKVVALMNALYLRRKKHLERILADPDLRRVFYDNLPEDLQERLALPAPEPRYEPGSDAEPIPVRRGLLKRLHACFLSHTPRNCRAGQLTVQAILDGVEPPDLKDIFLLPEDLLRRDNYRKTRIWKVLAEHDDAEAEQARRELQAIALYVQAALNFYEDIHQGFTMFDREVWGIARSCGQ